MSVSRLRYLCSVSCPDTWVSKITDNLKITSTNSHFKVRICFTIEYKGVGAPVSIRGWRVFDTVVLHPTISPSQRSCLKIKYYKRYGKNRTGTYFLQRVTLTSVRITD